MFGEVKWGILKETIMAEEIDNKRFEEIARKILDMEKKLKAYNYPEPTGVLVSWKGYTYIGIIQVIVPEFSKEIVFLSKSSSPIVDKLAGVIRNINKGISELIADDYLDLTGRYHILRRLENRLIKMTTEQDIYMVNHTITIKEVNI